MKIFSKVILTLSVVALANPVQVSAGWKTKAAAGAAGVAVLGLVTWAYFSYNKKKSAQAADTVQDEQSATPEEEVVAPVVSEGPAQKARTRAAYLELEEKAKRDAQAEVDSTLATIQNFNSSISYAVRGGRGTNVMVDLWEKRRTATAPNKKIDAIPEIAADVRVTMAARVSAKS